MAMVVGGTVAEEAMEAEEDIKLRSKYFCWHDRCRVC